MRKSNFLVALVFVQSAYAQKFPIELEADRIPKLHTGGSCLIRHAYVLTATKGNLEDTDVLIQNGKITKIGRNLKGVVGVTEIDGKGKVLAPGIVDGHSHRGSDGTNEGAESLSDETRIGDVLNPSALNVWQAVASGHTSAMILHGSANAVGGESQVCKYKYGRSTTEMKIADAPRMVKFALGENVTRKSDTTGARWPRSRMGVEALYRRAFTEARGYIQDWEDFRAGKGPHPRYDLRLETLADILRGKVWVQCHSYRSDEILMMVRLSQEFGFKIGAMQHALEAYKIAPELGKAHVGASIFVDNWSFKQEGYDAIPWGAAILHKAGVNVSINTDGTGGTTALNIDAAKVMRYGNLNEQEALQMVTINSAKELGIDHRTGSIEVGKDGDVVLWNGHPLSVYSRCEMTLIEGEVYFERKDAFGIDSQSLTKQKLDKQKNKGEAKPLPIRNSYVIRGATIYPISGSPLVGASVVIENGKITAVGKEVPIPNGAFEVQANGMRVYPGFFDGYSSVGLQEISPIAVMGDLSELGDNQPDMDALTALWVESAHFGPARYAGVTNGYMAPSRGTIAGQGAVINMNGYSSEQFGVKRKAALMVNFTTPRTFNFDLCDDQVTANQLLGIEVDDNELTNEQREQFYDMLGGAPAPQQQPTTQDPQNDVERYFDRVIAYLKDRKTDKKSQTDLRMEAMIPYVTGQKEVMLNVRSAASIRSAITFAKKYKLKAILRGANEAWKETKAIKESGYPVIINPAGNSTLNANSTESSWDPYDTPYVLPGILERAGIKFCFQTGDGSNLMNLPCRVGESCAYGLSLPGALRALTLSPAEIFGVQDQLGSIEAGKMANLIICDGDPFEFTSSVRNVFIKGEPQKMESKHTMLRDKYSTRK